MRNRKYPKSYVGPKEGESSTEEWMALRWYDAYINVMKGNWTYSDFNCFCVAVKRSGLEKASEVLSEFQKLKKD